MRSWHRPTLAGVWPILRRHGLAVALFALIAGLFQAACIGGERPFVTLGGDAGNIASFAAAWDNPGAFKGDEALGDPGNFRFYATIHIPLLRVLRPLYGDYGSAFMAMLGLHVFLQGLGFYALGVA